MVYGSRTFSPPDICPPYEKWHVWTSAPQTIDRGGLMPPQQMHNGGYFPPLKTMGGHLPPPPFLILIP